MHPCRRHLNAGHAVACSLEHVIALASFVFYCSARGPGATAATGPKSLHRGVHEKALGTQTISWREPSQVLGIVDEVEGWVLDDAVELLRARGNAAVLAAVLV